MNNLFSCKQALELAEADIVIHTGGEDVCPSLYGEAPTISGGKHSNLRRDSEDIEAYRNSQGKMHIGICRGGQFLNVMNGGKLWQHVNNHGGTHRVLDTRRPSGEEWWCSSTHHQQFRPARDAVIVGIGIKSAANGLGMSTYKEAEGVTWATEDGGQIGSLSYADHEEGKVDYEVLWYPRTRTLCFQPHPEYSMPLQTAKFFDSVVSQYYKE